MKHHENGGVFKKAPVSPAQLAPAKTCLSSGKAAAALARRAYRGVREHDKVARMQLADFFNTPSMNPTIFSMQIPACADAAEIAGVLACPEFLGAWEQDDTLVMYWQGKEEDIVPQMQMALQHFDVQLPDGAIRIQRVKDEDWNAQWAGRQIAIDAKDVRHACANADPCAGITDYRDAYQYCKWRKQPQEARPLCN